MYHVVYKTTRPSTGEYYIGKHSTENLDDGYQGSGLRLKRILAIEKCTTEIIHYCETEKEAYEKEAAIVTVGLLGDNLCLNMRVGGLGFGCGEANPMFGKTHTEATKRKLSVANKGENNNMFGRVGELCPMFGKTHSKETRLKISLANTGEKHHLFGLSLPDETKQKISKALEGKFKGENSPLFGKKLSLEVRAKMSEAKKGEKHNLFGTKWSDETRTKIIKSLPRGESHLKFKGYYHTPKGCYSSTRVAGRSNNCTHTTIRSRVKSTKFPDYWFEPISKEGNPLDGYVESGIIEKVNNKGEE